MGKILGIALVCLMLGSMVVGLPSAAGAQDKPIAKIDQELLNLIDQYAEGYYNDTWNLTLNQYKAWIVTIAWSEGGSGGYTAHSRFGSSKVSLKGDRFNHINKSAAKIYNFSFSTGIGPFQIDRGGPFGWSTRPTIEKLNSTKSLLEVLTWHYNYTIQGFGKGTNLCDFQKQASEVWYGVESAEVGIRWNQVTGTNWNAHKNGEADLDWKSIKQNIADNDPKNDLIKNIGERKWNVTFTIDNKDIHGNRMKVSFKGYYDTWLITARGWSRTTLFHYYYTYNESTGCEVWVIDNSGNEDEFRYIFARNYTTGEFPENRTYKGEVKIYDEEGNLVRYIACAGETLKKPALNPNDRPGIFKLDAVSPTASNPAIVGDPSNPAEFNAEVSTGIPFLLILPSAFNVKIGNKPAGITVIPSFFKNLKGIYILQITPPTQNTEGSYDLNISFSLGEISDYDIQPDAVVYSTGGNIDVMEVIDRSGSMGGEPIQAAKDSAKLFIDLMKANDMIGVASYSSSASVNYGLTGIDGKDNIISDVEYRDYQSMSLAQIQTFLESWNSHLATYRAEDYLGVERNASEIIYNAAQNYSINPEVILATLQKEQSLITDPNPKEEALNWAMGYGDYGDYMGFGNQVNNATRQFDRYWTEYLDQGKPTFGWNVNVEKKTEDGVNLIPQNKATAALYAYTPHAGSGWGGKGGGNYLFWKLYYDKFGFASHVKQNAKNAIDGISAGGMTSIGAGLRAAYNELVNKGDPSHPHSIVLMSDGWHNTAPHPDTVLPDIRNANIRVFTIGLGAGADASLLSHIAHDSGGGGGEYYYSPGSGELSAIYNAIAGVVRAESTVKTVTGSVQQGETITHKVDIDPTIDIATFTVTWTSGTLNLELKRPNGSKVDPSDPGVSHTKEATYETYTIDNPMVGEWTMEITAPITSSSTKTSTTSNLTNAWEDVIANEANNTMNDNWSTEIDVPARIKSAQKALAQAGISYTATVTATTNLTVHMYTDKDKYSLTEPIKIITTLTKAGSPVTGADVEVTIERPDTVKEYLSLYNDGKHDDGIALDGVYANYYTNTDVSGSYTITVHASGTASPEEFIREVKKSVYVSGVPAGGISVTPASWDTGMIVLCPDGDTISAFTVSSTSTNDETVTISATDLTDAYGNVIRSENVISMPSTFVVPAGGSGVIYERIYVPETTKTGNYTGSIVLMSTANSVNIPVALQVRPPPVITVYVDIKPSSCPNPLNLKSKRVPVVVLGTEDFDVTSIDPSTIMLTREGIKDGVALIRYSYEDVATPFEGELCNCHDLDGDGYMDLTLKFDTQKLVSNLELDKVAGNTIPLTLTGNLKEEESGTPIEGEDCVWVLN